MTPEERILWNILRNRKFMGFKFLRQHPIFASPFKDQPAFYVADFYCSEKKLVIEADGPIHDFQQAYDEMRDSLKCDRGINILRLTNEEINIHLDLVLEKIAKYLR